MKVKKNRESVIRAFRSITDKDINVLPTMITVDISGNVIIDGTNKFLNYDSRQISVNTQGRTVYISGEELRIVACSRENIHISGKIQKIELFEVK